MKYRNIINYKYELMESETFKVKLPDTKKSILYVYIENGILHIIKHYAWDGSSIPLKSYYSWIWDSDKYCKIASLVHDALCQLIRAGELGLVYREYADGLYRDMSIEGGMPKWQADFRYWALRKFGKSEVVKPKNPIIRYKHGKNNR